MLDPAEFLSDYGIRAVSRYHLDHRYEFKLDGAPFTVKYWPAESDSRLFGGNSNWRGPIWFPVNYMLIRSLHEFSLTTATPSRSSVRPARARCSRSTRSPARSPGGSASIFLRDDAHGAGARCWGDNEYFQTDPHWRDCMPFSEYFNGDTGAGVGASHQTGWTALVVSLLYEYGGRGRGV